MHNRFIQYLSEKIAIELKDELLADKTLRVAEKKINILFLTNKPLYQRSQQTGRHL